VDWIIGGFSIGTMELIARRKWYGWALGLLGQVPWLWLIVQQQLWGFLPVTFFLAWRYTRALRSWRQGALVGAQLKLNAQ
jgi:hypothetical protein